MSGHHASGMKSRISFAYSSFDTILRVTAVDAINAADEAAKQRQLTGTAPLWAGFQAQSAADHLGARCADCVQISSISQRMASHTAGNDGTHFEKRVALRVFLEENAAAVSVVREVHIAFSGALDLVEVAPALRANAFDTLRGRVVECISDVHRRSMWL